MQRINAPFELKDADSKGRFKGELAVFDNTDLGNDVMLSGCIKSVKTTRDGMLRMAVYHDMQRFVGKATYKQTKTALEVEGALEMDISYVPDQYKLIRAGILDGMSVGFDIMEGGARYEKGIRLISKAELWEGSFVPFGMNPEAKVTDIKSYNIHDIRKLEQIAKNSGCSRSEAVAISSLFKKHLSDSGLFNPQSDFEKTDGAMLLELNSIFKQFKRI